MIYHTESDAETSVTLQDLLEKILFSLCSKTMYQDSHQVPLIDNHITEPENPLLQIDFDLECSSAPLIYLKIALSQNLGGVYK